MRELFFDIKMAFRDNPWKVTGELIGATLYLIWWTSFVFTVVYVIAHFIIKYW